MIRRFGGAARKLPFLLSQSSQKYHRCYKPATLFDQSGYLTQPGSSDGKLGGGRRAWVACSKA